MRVSEIFYSLQGEGMLVGTPSVFVRLAGCPLRCRWCDTKYAWSFTEGTDYALADLCAEIERQPSRFVVITGGEPLVGPDFAPRPDLIELTHRLRDQGKHVTIETAGVIFVPGLACDLMSISPKLSNSVPDQSDLAGVHERGRPDPEVLTALIQAYSSQLKFVVDAEADLGEIHELLAQLPALANERVLLMPQATSREELLNKASQVAQWCRDGGFRFGPRLHLRLWGNRRGT